MDFSKGSEAVSTTVTTRVAAQKLLAEGGAVGIFPGGGVSTSLHPAKGTAVDPAWHPFTAKLIKSSKATVVPLFFSGQNSRIFQAASHYSEILRTSLLFRETARRIGTRVSVAIGEPVEHRELAGFANRHDLVRHLRQRTYELAGETSGNKCKLPDYRQEFEYPASYRFA